MIVKPIHFRDKQGINYRLEILTEEPMKVDQVLDLVHLPSKTIIEEKEYDLNSLDETTITIVNVHDWSETIAKMYMDSNPNTDFLEKHYPNIKMNKF
jgi:hypothetical protein